MSTRKHIKVTYSTLGSPDPLLHEYYEEALATARAQLGQTHRLLIGGDWGEARTTYTTHSPIDTSLRSATFRKATPATSTGPCARRAPPSRPGATRRGKIACVCCAAWPS